MVAIVNLVTAVVVCAVVFVVVFVAVFLVVLLALFVYDSYKKSCRKIKVSD